MQMKKKKSVIKMLLLSFLLVFVTPCICGMGKAEAKTTISKKKITLAWNKSKTLSVKGATKRVQWKSNKPGIVKITKTSGSKKQKATVKAVATSGKAVITAKVGSKKLKATVTVRHSHSYTIPATCTSPARCKCGATSGPALGHSWIAGNCISRARCQRCNAQGSFGAHQWTNNICIKCHNINIENLLDVSFTKGEGNFLWLTYDHSANVDFSATGFVLYPDGNSSASTGLTIANNDGSTTNWNGRPYMGWTFSKELSYETGRLNINTGSLSVWNNPRVEFILEIVDDVYYAGDDPIIVKGQAYKGYVYGDRSSGNYTFKAVRIR